MSVDAEGRLHVGKDNALDEPASLIDLRSRTAGMLPGVDLPEMILEVMAQYPAFAAAFTAVSGGTTRLKDMHISIAALLTAHSLNVGFGPVLADADALTRDRLAHVDQHYLRPENYAAANAVLIEAQAAIGLAQTWGGGMVAAVDGMHFVVPVRTADARPNPKYFARKRGVTWLNMISDQAVGLAGKVISGTPKDTLHVVDLVYNPDGGPRPEVLITDQGSYSDVVFGIVTLLGFDYRPVLADLPDAKLWRINASADYGTLDKTARGRVDLDKIRRHWPDILRVIASVHTREVSAHDVIRILQHDGRLTPLGEAIASYGRIFKTLHVLAFVDDPAYRRQLKTMRNLQEGRHGLGRHVFHGRRGELHRAYHAGMEDQLGALGPVLNCVTLWNTLYLDHDPDPGVEQGLDQDDVAGAAAADVPARRQGPRAPENSSVTSGLNHRQTPSGGRRNNISVSPTSRNHTMSGALLQAGCPGPRRDQRRTGPGRRRHDRARVPQPRRAGRTDRGRARANRLSCRSDAVCAYETKYTSPLTSSPRSTLPAAGHDLRLRRRTGARGGRAGPVCDARYCCELAAAEIRARCRPSPPPGHRGSRLPRLCLFGGAGQGGSEAVAISLLCGSRAGEGV